MFTDLVRLYPDVMERVFLQFEINGRESQNTVVDVSYDIVSAT